MADPFMNNDDAMGALEADVKRLRQENRELRLTNTNLRARLALATPEASVTGDDADGSLNHPNIWQRLQTPTAHSAASSEAGTRRGTSASSHAGGDAEPPSGDSNGQVISTSTDTPATTTAAVAAAAAPARRRTRTAAAESVSATRIQDAIQQVKQELQGELETHRKSAAAEKAAKEHLKREFELFVSTTCEREAAYQLVHTQMFREAEEQRARLQAAQAQLEEQRQLAVEMRRSLEAAVAAARAEGRPASPPASAATAGEKDDGSASRAPKKRRTRKEGRPVASKGAEQQQPQQSEILAGAHEPGAMAQEATSSVEAPSESASVAATSTADASAPRSLKILAGGASLRNAPRRTAVQKRQREPATVLPSLARVQAGVDLHVPVAPVFASGPQSAPNSAAPPTGTAPAPLLSSAASSSSSGRLAAASSPAAAHGPVESLWRLLSHHTEATEGFLPIWQCLATLPDPDRLAVLGVLVSLLVHLVGPQSSSAAAFTAGQASPPHIAASLPASFVTQPTSITVVATAVRLLTVQYEDAALQQQQQPQQQRGAAEAGRQARVLLGSLFYRLCVAALCRWQAVDGAAGDALEHWATAVNRLYGFHLDLVRLTQYTNTTTAYHRTRLPRSWISLTAQCIFGRCCTESSASAADAAASSSLAAETAASRWGELCDSVGWSNHALPLERLETAAARCVAMARVGHGPFTVSCAEEALLALRLVVLYKGFDHMEQLARLLEQPGVLPMAMTKEIYAELVSLAVRDAVPFRTRQALHHALELLKEYVTEAAPERCTSAEHFVSAARRSHVMAALALLRVESSGGESASGGGGGGGGARASEAVVQAGRRTVLQWLQAQKVALEMAHQSSSLPLDRPLPLRDTSLGRTLLRLV